MSFWKKLGSGLKKVAPFAAAALPFIPGIGSALGGMVSKVAGSIGGFMGGSSAQANAPPSENPQVNINGKRDPFDWSGALGQAAQVGIPAFMNYMGQREQNQSNAAAAAKQMDFQAAQTGSSYQRGVADMKAAGLNPMLAYSQGGAASGSGASYQAGNELGAGVSSALSVAQARQQMQQSDATINNIKADTENKAEQTENIKADTLHKYALTTHSGTQNHETAQRVAQIALHNQLAAATQGYHISSAKFGADYSESKAAGEKYSLAHKSAESDFWKGEFGKSYPYVSRVTEQASNAANIARMFIPFTNR